MIREGLRNFNIHGTYLGSCQNAGPGSIVLGRGLLVGISQTPGLMDAAGGRASLSSAGLVNKTV